MPEEVRLWCVGADDELREVQRANLDLENRLQEWLVQDIGMIDPGLLVIGREVPTDFGGFIDILCIDAAGDLVVVELKRGKTPREITAQSIEYAAWVVDLSNDRVAQIADEYLGAFEQTFRSRFQLDLPEMLNGDHRILIVGSEIDASSERIIEYLSSRQGVNINAATFQYFRNSDGRQQASEISRTLFPLPDLHGQQ